MRAGSGRRRRRGLVVGLTAGPVAALLALLPTGAAGPADARAVASLPQGPLVEVAWPEVPAQTRTSTPAARRQLAVPPPETTAAPVAPALATPASAIPASASPAATTPPPADPAELPDLPRSTAAASALAASGIPTTALEAYTRAADGVDCGLDWTLLAAIGRVESNHGRFAGAVLHTDGLSTPPVVGIALTGAGTALVLDTDDGRFDRDTVHDRAVGPMQFIPGTWARYGSDGNGDGRKDPFNVHDAAAAAARYLCAAGGDLSGVAGQARAVFAYNHSSEYVASVLRLAATYAGTTPPPIPTPEPATPPTVPPVDPAGPPALAPAPVPVEAPPAPPVVVAAEAPAPPALAPAAGPVPAPEPAPTPEPSGGVEVSVTPTSEPTATPQPSSTPTPSSEPPVTPTPEPSLEPTATPTPETSPEPSSEPTATPSPEPTATPSPEPTATPSPEPTATPSPEPTATPTAEPTPSAELAPTPTPSAEVTPAPSPTATPSAEVAPAPAPSAEPSPVPTPSADVTPTPVPSAEPSPVPTPSAEVAPTPTLTPTPVPTPTPDVCPAVGAPDVVDIVNGTGDPAIADEVAAHLAAAGLTIGTVTAAEPAASGIEHPVGSASPGEWLTGALGTTQLLRQGEVGHVTVVLAATDPADLLAALRALPACG
ncbi:lytic transglycosylase domain-containing protein [Modestobacter altitudinis]|uniref:lytic transglycosylase domain-containing protein n=1 Tax=Modestobacter altitudinis TaxID=2213158 RepID=UPI001C556754|nr:lytic transglycosylase domain-containing protein [Modestobacter altitudinis]